MIHDQLGILQGGLPSDFGVRAGSKPLRDLAAELDSDPRFRLPERLKVRVGGDEVDALDSHADHAIDGVSPPTADTDDLDAGLASQIVIKDPFHAVVFVEFRMVHGLPPRRIFTSTAGRLRRPPTAT